MGFRSFQGIGLLFSVTNKHRGLTCLVRGTCPGCAKVLGPAMHVQNRKCKAGRPTMTKQQKVQHILRNSDASRRGTVAECK